MNPATVAVILAAIEEFPAIVDLIQQIVAALRAGQTPVVMIRPKPVDIAGALDEVDAEALPDTERPR